MHASLYSKSIKSHKTLCSPSEYIQHLLLHLMHKRPGYWTWCFIHKIWRRCYPLIPPHPTPNVTATKRLHVLNLLTTDIQCTGTQCTDTQCTNIQCTDIQCTDIQSTACKSNYCKHKIAVKDPLPSLKLYIYAEDMLC